ncbi:hypothetical protein CGMCC3_g2731 [Colletotrichum fructicola]|uniref:Heterokaryon incompatibility protein n=1 Tax=Colletotrichum fructicola (strain Nara gc5) TaxID=1213859 RepID=L2G4G3_COLFN|nr:uncharacterized protein CGMCC3_g2731 [Colletotrichum fructicola]KAE9581179.1 hypothetical protein CGMCC3_g2731 [Colletotrichum fructicola]
MDVTRKLGARYLWIDSLCIVQDDADDWDREAARMAQVYSQAYVTIAATSAPDGTHGLIRKARNEPLIPLHFQSSDSLNRGVSIGPSLSKFQRIDREPLNSRAWTLQERVLSPRTLHYAADQVHWECRQSIISESGSSPYGYGQGESAENSIVRGWLGKMARDIVPDIKPGNEEVSKSVRGDPNLAINNSNVSYENWYRMLQNYTERNITKDADRLPALSGIARAFSSKKPSPYLAGIWLDDITSGLLWYVNVPESARYPDTYRAPSWSWAAVEGSPVTFLSTHFFGRRPGEVDEIEYVDHNVDLDSADPFGRVKAGSLTLRGYVKAAMLKTVQEGQEIEGVRASMHVLFDEESAIGTANLDVAIADGPVHCLLATCTYPQDSSLHYTPNVILLLRSFGNAGQFQRVGMAGLFPQRIREPQKHFDPIPQPGDPSFTQTGKVKLDEQTAKGESLETWFDEIETSVISII